MTLRNAAGDILNKTELHALAPQEPVPVADRKISVDIYEDYRLSGEGDRFESGKRKKFRAGQVVKQSAIDALYPTATVTSITPATGLAAGGGTPKTIKGTNLHDVEGVDFGGAAATQVKRVDNETVTCVVPPHAAGAVTVTVKAGSGDVVKAAFYTYT